MKTSRSLPIFAVATLTLVAVSIITYAAAAGDSSYYLDSVREFFGVVSVQTISTIEQPQKAKALPTPRRLALSNAIIWANTGTDFNTAANWGGTLPGATDVATFASAASVQPNVSSNITVSGVNVPAGSSG
ncbi:MAG: hypothetical protein ACRD43_03535, partial [Pyrinomonadaceae bacterium]